jgi:site-specific recombinase
MGKPAPADHSVRFIEQTLARMAEARPPDIALLARLWFHLRPHANQRLAAGSAHLHGLIALLETNPSYIAALRDHLITLFKGVKATRVLTEAGLLPNRAFGLELRRRIGYKLLPPANDPSHLRDWLDAQIAERDSEWVTRTDPADWQRVCDLLELQQLFQRGAPGVLTTAINSLAHRVAAGGLDPELLRIDPALEEYDSPFLALHDEVAAWLRGESGDTLQIDVLIDQCNAALDRVRRRTREVGTSIDLTLQELRLSQQMLRMRNLIALTDPATEHPHARLVQLFVELIAASHERYSIGNLVSETTGGLARQITQFASRTGEHYVAEGWPAVKKMFRAASGGGVIIAGLALLKIRLVAEQLAPLQEALLVSLNYALGFLLIYLLHLTVASKQPAMTASLFARSLTEARSQKAQQKWLNAFAEKVWRSQASALLGNMLFAFATAVLVALAFDVAGHAAVGAGKAANLLDEIDPLNSAALFYAAVAGIGLFLAGIVSGYYDNQCVYRAIPARLQYLAWPQRLIGVRLWKAVVAFLAPRWGGIAGNLFFGFYLGLASAFGKLAGLPLDIRHIAFSAANFGYAWQAFDWQLGWSVVLASLAGVVLIGLVNLTVSFSLAFYVALRATRTPRRESGLLLLRGLYAILTAPFRLSGMRLATQDKS